jgi:hypothetical protein
MNTQNELPRIDIIVDFFETNFWKLDSNKIFLFTDMYFRKKNRITSYLSVKPKVQVFACKKLEDESYGILLGVCDSSTFCLINLISKIELKEIRIFNTYQHSWSGKFDLFINQNPNKQMELIMYQTIPNLILNDEDYFLSPKFDLRNLLHQEAVIVLPRL